MGLNNNFDQTLLLGADGILHVTGTSVPMDGVTLVSRHVSVQQGNNVIGGPANFADGWAAEPPLQAAGIGPGPAMAIGTETHFTKVPAASFATSTWTQFVTIEATA